MGLAVYIHIPYCLQRCRYCDFTTFEASQIMPPHEYRDLILTEIRNRQHLVQERELVSIYFGGGTPSLVPADHIVAILKELANVGFKISPNTEITVEINPATVDPIKLELYLQNGINRFSVGAQTFNDDLLKLCGRKHSADDTRHTLRLLDQRQVNYSFDLLFALPGQTLAGLKSDLEEVARYRPRHLSAYCLTVPEGHPMSVGRPLEEKQIEMFDLIEQQLESIGLKKYEISNFAQPGFESRHNSVYWQDQPYWGLGLSSHSYSPQNGPWGTRYWNPQKWDDYIEQVKGQDALAQGPEDLLPAQQKELLKIHESLSDYGHIFLRTQSGLDVIQLRKKFGVWAEILTPRLNRLEERGFLTRQGDRFSLSKRGSLLSNQVFAELYVTEADCPPKMAAFKEVQYGRS